MNPIVKNVLAAVAGILVGMTVNGGLIQLSPMIIPPPEGVDVTSTESLAENMHLFEPKNYVMPFLAHALGTLVGAFVAGLIAASHKMAFAMSIGVFFLFGGIYMTTIIPSPLWYTIIDLAGAYLPMAYLAGRYSSKAS